MNEGQAAEVHLLTVQVVADGQAAEEVPAGVAGLLIGLVLQLPAGPIAGPLGAKIEAMRLVKHGAIMVSHERHFGLFDHQVQAFLRVRAVADHVAQTDDTLHVAPVDIGQHGGKRFVIGMNVTDDRQHASHSSRRSRYAIGA